MMQVQGSNMMDSMGGNPAAAFWGARHPSWPATSHASHQGSNATPNQDPKVAEKLMTELQVRFPLLLSALFLVLYYSNNQEMVKDTSIRNSKWSEIMLSSTDSDLKTLLGRVVKKALLVIFY